jgi:NADH dehydrogenase
MAKARARPRVVVVGAGFAGLNAARALAASGAVELTVIDRRNHHLFQPLLYQVAMAGLSPAQIAIPIRSLLSRWKNTRVVRAEVSAVDLAARCVATNQGAFAYDLLVLATGADSSYFGHDDWSPHAPGLKTLAQATEIRRRVLTAFEDAETASAPAAQRRLLTFVVVGGGPTGVELAGAIGEMSRFTLARDFRNVDPKLARVVLVEGGPRILATFSPRASARATRDLEHLGVQVWTNSVVSRVDADGIEVGADRLSAATVLWAAGVRASPLGERLGVPCDRQGRVLVNPDLSLQGHPEVFVLGDLAHSEQGGRVLPGVAPVAMQQGRHVAAVILAELAGRARRPFRYLDKGNVATIGRSRAVVEMGGLALHGLVAWLVWLVVHIYYLSGFQNRLLVLIQWAWSYVTFGRGARLIVDPEPPGAAAGERELASPAASPEPLAQRTA